MKSYQAGHKRYLAFCTKASRQAIPTSKNTLMMFASHLAKEGLSHQSIKVHLAAVRNLHVTAGQHVVMPLLQKAALLGTARILR